MEDSMATKIVVFNNVLTSYRKLLHFDMQQR